MFIERVISSTDNTDVRIASYGESSKGFSSFSPSPSSPSSILLSVFVSLNMVPENGVPVTPNRPSIPIMRIVLSKSSDRLLVDLDKAINNCEIVDPLTLETSFIRCILSTQESLPAGDTLQLDVKKTELYNIVTEHFGDSRRVFADSIGSSRQVSLVGEGSSTIPSPCLRRDSESGSVFVGLNDGDDLEAMLSVLEWVPSDALD